MPVADTERGKKTPGKTVAARKPFPGRTTPNSPQKRLRADRRFCESGTYGTRARVGQNPTVTNKLTGTLSYTAAGELGKAEPSACLVGSVISYDYNTNTVRQGDGPGNVPGQGGPPAVAVGEFERKK